MTVIVANKECMYADSQLSEGTIITTGYKKIEQSGDVIAGGAGEYTSVVKFLKWVKEGMDPENIPSLDEDFIGLVLTKKGKLLLVEQDMYPIELEEPHAAVGSGSEYAIAMLDAGKHPFEVCKAVCKRHTDCSEPIYGAWFDKEGS